MLGGGLPGSGLPCPNARNGSPWVGVALSKCSEGASPGRGCPVRMLGGGFPRSGLGSRGFSARCSVRRIGSRQLAVSILRAELVFTNLRQTFRDVGKVVANFGQTFRDVGKLVMNLGQTFRDVGKVVVNFGQTFRDVGKLVMNLGQTFRDVGKLVANLGQTFRDVEKLVMNFGQTFRMIHTTDARHLPMAAVRL